MKKPQPAEVEPGRPTPLAFGRSTFELRPADATRFSEGPSAFVTIELDWSPRFEGSTGTVQLHASGMRQVQARIAAYGPTRLDVFPLEASPAVDISLDVHVDVPGPNLCLNSPGGEGEVARLLTASIEPYEHKKDPRMAALRIAAATSKQMGLMGVYMTPERTELLAGSVCRALADGRGYSFVRMGDGEGRLLGFPGFISPNEARTQILNYHFGPISMRGVQENNGLTWVEDAMEELGGLLRTSLLAADEVGLPVSEFFQTIETAFVTGHLGYAAALNGYVALKGKSLGGYHYGTNVFQQLARTNQFFGKVAAAAREVFTVGPWDLTSELSSALKLDKIHHVPVQRHFTFAEPKTWGQFPFHHHITRAALHQLGDLRGMLFFVGAGLLGKSYCTQIKEQGGVALDIGAVFDAWAKKGRPDAVRSGNNISFDRLA